MKKKTVLPFLEKEYNWKKNAGETSSNIVLY